MRTSPWSGLCALLAALVAPATAAAASTTSARSASTPPSSSPAIASAPTSAQPKSRVRAFSLGSAEAVVGAVDLHAEIASGIFAPSVEDGVRRASYGKEHDQLSDLYYYGARYFDPLSLTWTQADPMYRFAPDVAWDQPRRANLYGFSLNNALRFFDPDGEDPDEINAAVGSRAGGMTILPAGPLVVPVAKNSLAAEARDWKEHPIRNSALTFGPGVAARAVRGVGRVVGAVKRGVERGVSALKNLRSGSKAAKPGGPVTKLYHGGKLRGGKVEGRKFSTTTDKAHAEQYAARREGGEVHEFDVPTKELIEGEAAGGVTRAIDNLEGTAGAATEVTFLGNFAEKLNEYMRGAKKE